MRIVSENREIDVPYDAYTITILDEHIVAVNGNTNVEFWLAHPETHRQATRALNAIQDAYLSGAKIVYMDYIMEEVRDE